MAAVAALIGASATGASSNCSPVLPAAPNALPAPLLVTTACGSYTATPGGNVGAAPPPPAPGPPVPGLRVWWPDNGVGWGNHHVYVVRDSKVVWRSQHAFPEPDAVATSSSEIAFSVARKLWVARLDRAEQLVGRGNEAPIAWTAANMLLTLRPHRVSAELFARSESGGQRRLIAARIRVPTIDAYSHTLLFTTASGRLERTDGLVTQLVAELGGLGIRGFVNPEVLDRGLIALKARDRLVVLRSDGSLFASSLFPGMQRVGSGLNWFGAAAAGDGAVAFAIDQPDGNAADGSDTVFVLREGAARATPLFSAPLLGGDVCGHWVNLSWHGSWLLYWTSEARVVLFNLADAGRSVDLTSFVSQLPGAVATADGYVADFGASWGG
jgi:hypothetical protein